MTDVPLVSVVIPTYNRKKTLSRAIKSVVNQTYRNWELIIVDDGSTDNSREFIYKRYGDDPRIKYFRRPSYRSKGANACRNIGAEKTAGRYIAFLDSDDEWKPIHLDSKIKRFQEKKGAFCFGSFVSLKGNTQRKVKCTADNQTGRVDFYLYAGGDIRTSTFVVERSAFFEVKFDEELKKHQDWDFALRFCQKYSYLIDEKSTVILHATKKGNRMSEGLNHKATKYFIDRHKSHLHKLALKHILTVMGFATYRLEGRNSYFLNYAEKIRQIKNYNNKVSFLVSYILPIPVIGPTVFEAINYYLEQKNN